jgi:hypothetical protein
MMYQQQIMDLKQQLADVQTSQAAALASIPSIAPPISVDDMYVRSCL